MAPPLIVGKSIGSSACILGTCGRSTQIEPVPARWEADWRSDLSRKQLRLQNGRLAPWSFCRRLLGIICQQSLVATAPRDIDTICIVALFHMPSFFSRLHRGRFDGLAETFRSPGFDPRGSTIEVCNSILVGRR
jgi:hypothetical protein